MDRQIIVCDDEPHIIRAISLKLTRAGFDVKGAIDADSCWRMLHRDHHPSMLIIDDSMPAGSDGIDLIERLRSEESELGDLPVILLSSVHEESYQRLDQLMDLRIDRVVAKPFSPRHLLEVVNDLLPCVFGHATQRASDCRL